MSRVNVACFLDKRMPMTLVDFVFLVISFGVVGDGIVLVSLGGEIVFCHVLP